MKSTSRFSRTLLTIIAPALAVGMFLFGGSVVRADSVTTTVTAIGKKNATPPEIKKDDVKLYQGKEQMQVANWRRGDTLFLAVLIDDSLDPRLARRAPSSGRARISSACRAVRTRVSLRASR